MLESLVRCMTTMLSQNIFQWMWFLRLETGDKELPLCITLEWNQNLWQGQEWQLLNGSSSCRLTNTCVSCQMHDNDSIIGHLTMNVIPCASNWGQLPIHFTMGQNCQLWQGQEWQLHNQCLSCSNINAWVSCPMHNNNAITEHFPMNVIP